MARSSIPAPSRRSRGPPPSHAPHEPHDPRARRLRRLLRHLQGPEHAAYTADVGDQRHPRHRRARRPARPRPHRQRPAEQGDPRHRDRLRHDQRRRRVPGHRPHARDVQGQEARHRRGAEVVIAAVPGPSNLSYVLYIVAFSLFIYGLGGLTGPRTAVRGNRIAAVGMAIAVLATFLYDDFGNWGLVILGIAIGTAVGVPAARQVKMTAMPQMVALFNGVGGGAVALIAWAEFRNTGGFDHEPTYVAIFTLFAAIVGSVSFWGSNIAFAKLQELLPGRPIKIPGQIIFNVALLAASVACGVAIVAGSDSGALMIGLLVAAAVLGNFVVLPIGGADMPVVISLLNAFTGLSAAATGVALNNPALIVAGMIVGASGSILTNLMAQAMNRSIPAIVRGGFGGVVTTGGTGDDGVEKTVRSTSAADAAIQMSYANRVVIVPGYGMAVAQAQHAVREMTKLLEAKGVEVAFAIHPVAGRMPGH